MLAGDAVLSSLEYHGSNRYAAWLHAIETALFVVFAAEFLLVCGQRGRPAQLPAQPVDFLVLLAAGAEYESMAVSLVLDTDVTTRAVFALRPFRLGRPFRAECNKNELVQVLDALLHQQVSK